MLTQKAYRTALVALLAFTVAACNEAAPVEVTDTSDFIEPTPLVESASKAEKVTVCHVAGKSGGYRILNVAAPALQAHLRHGDGVPFAPVKGMEGFVFNDACEIVPECPCFGRATLDVALATSEGLRSCTLDAYNIVNDVAVYYSAASFIGGNTYCSGAGCTASGLLVCRPEETPSLRLITPEEDATCVSILKDFCAANLPG